MPPPDQHQNPPDVQKPPQPPGGVGVAAPYGLGAAGGSTTSPAAVGFAAALGGVVGFATGALIGSEFGTGPAMVRRAGGGALIGMIVGSFTGAAVMAPSTSSQGT